MNRDIIDKVKAEGFSVYMRSISDPWLIFADAGGNLGCLQYTYSRGIALSTVHKPNQTTGTGYAIAELIPLAMLDASKLREAFILAPAGAPKRDRESIRKYKGIDDYKRENVWNSAYQLI